MKTFLSKKIGKKKKISIGKILAVVMVVSGVFLIIDDFIINKNFLRGIAMFVFTPLMAVLLWRDD